MRVIAGFRDVDLNESVIYHTFQLEFMHTSTSAIFDISYPVIVSLQYAEDYDSKPTPLEASAAKTYY